MKFRLPTYKIPDNATYPVGIWIDIPESCQVCGSKIPDISQPGASGVEWSTFSDVSCSHYYHYQTIWELNRPKGPTKCMKCGMINEYVDNPQYVCYNCRV